MPYRLINNPRARLDSSISNATGYLGTAAPARFAYSLFWAFEIRLDSRPLAGEAGGVCRVEPLVLSGVSPL